MFRTLSPLLALTALTFACGAPVTPRPVDAGEPPPEDAGVDAGIEDNCPEGSHLGASGACESFLLWSDGTALPYPRDHHVTVITESASANWLYVISGFATETNQPFLNSVRAKIKADGSLDAWEVAGDFPMKLFGPSGARIDDAVLVTDGVNFDTSQLSTKTFVSKVASDGSLGTWTPGPDLAPGRFHHCSATLGKTMLVTGGGAGSYSLDDVWSTTYQDGAFTPWTQLRSLPAGRSHHGCIATHGALYVFGGLNGSPANGQHGNYKDILRAELNADGTLGEWTKISDLPVELGVFSISEYNGKLYALGGVESDTAMTNGVWSASISADGKTLGPWQSVIGFTKPHGHVHQTPVWRNFIYSAGGRNSQEFTIPDVYVGRFD